MKVDKQKIEDYYDQHINGKIRGYVYGNLRVTKAFSSLIENIKRPTNILEIGCGIGDICQKMSEYWENSQVMGLDISKRSIEIAKKLFSSEKISFVEGILDAEKLGKQFDLIVLMDVYEHIAETDRKAFQDNLKKLLCPNGTIFLSFPTPRHQDFLRATNIKGLQPIDEDINLETIMKLSDSLERQVLLYKEISVWHNGDYGHAVLGSYSQWEKTKNNSDSINLKKSLIKRLRKRILKENEEELEIRKKINLIENKLQVGFKSIV